MDNLYLHHHWMRGSHSCAHIRLMKLRHGRWSNLLKTSKWNSPSLLPSLSELDFLLWHFSSGKVIFDYKLIWMGSGWGLFIVTEVRRGWCLSQKAVYKFMARAASLQGPESSNSWWLYPFCLGQLAWEVGWVQSPSWEGWITLNARCHWTMVTPL